MVIATAADMGLVFGDPRVVMTSFGERKVLEAAPTAKFWEVWRSHKDALKKMGYSVSKYTGQWKVTFWEVTMDEGKRKENLAASRAQDSDIDIPVPAGQTMMPFQKAGVAYAMAREGTLIGDEMGLGKTVQAIAFANKIEAKRILVVARASLLANWRNEICRWQTLDLPVSIVRPGKFFPVNDRGWVVINYDIVSRYEESMKARTWDLVIYDECQDLKTRNAKRTITLLGGKAKAVVAGERRMVEHKPVPAKRRLMLTGTPILNRPSEIFSIIHALDPTRWTSYSKFLRRYCEGHPAGASNLDELNLRLRETVMVRRLKKDVLTELPAKIRQVIELENDDPEVQALIAEENRLHDKYERAVAESTYAMQTAEAEGDEAAYKAAVGKLKEAYAVAFERMAAVRHETAVAKVPQVIDHLMDMDGKVVVFCHHRDVASALVDALKPFGVVSITGDTKNDLRQPIVEAFQTDPAIRFFVGNIRAAGVGLTLTASSQVVFAELDWTPGNVTQAEDRCHRIGQRDTVLVQHICLNGSLDAKMAKMLVEKQKVIEAALDKVVEPKVKQETEREAATPIILADPEPERQGQLPLLTADQVEATMQALRIVSGMDLDGAQALNGIGFSKLDTRFGNELAARQSLSPRQAAAARKMIRKYRRQYPQDLFNRMFPPQMEVAE